MVKALFLQSIYNIVDESMETEIYDNVRFVNFLDYPERVPDQNTIWLFRERLSKTGKDKALWKEVWRQFKERGVTVRNGTIHDATFITSDPGHRSKDKPDVIDPQSIPPLREGGTDDPADKDKQARKALRMEERRNAKTRRSKDGSWTSLSEPLFLMSMTFSISRNVAARSPSRKLRNLVISSTSFCLYLAG